MKQTRVVLILQNCSGSGPATSGSELLPSSRVPADWLHSSPDPQSVSRLLVASSVLAFLVLLGVKCPRGRCLGRVMDLCVPFTTMKITRLCAITRAVEASAVSPSVASKAREGTSMPVKPGANGQRWLTLPIT
jgi:hypothetical protein